MGFDVCRVRDHDALARVEVPPERIAEAMERREAVVAELRDVGYAYVTVDLAGYRAGSMNDALQAPPDPSAARR